MSNVNNTTNADVMAAFNKLNQDAATNDDNMSSTVKQDTKSLSKAIEADGDLSRADKKSLLEQVATLLPMAGEAGHGEEWNEDMQNLVNQLSSLPQSAAPDASDETNNTLPSSQGSTQHKAPTVVPSSPGIASLSDTTLYPNGPGPKLEDIQQGALTDCTIDAALSSLASNSPSKIANMFHKNDDGTYDVTLYPKGQQTTTTIDPKTDLIPNGTTGAKGEPTWASLVEAAARKVGFDLNAPGGAQPGDAMQLLTGTTGWAGSTSDFGDTQNLETSLKNSLAGGHLIMAGSPTDSTVHGAKIEHDHAYAVLSVEDGNVTVRNPWKNQANDGLITMSLAEYAKAFAWTYMQD